MKNILTIILVTLGLCAAQAQTTMNIYQSNGTNISLPIATVDSMNFTTSPPPSSLNIYQYGGGVIIVVLANIDSITYTVTSISNGLPILSTMPVGNITNNIAVAGGNIINDGGSPVNQRGVCWSTSPTPTIANNKTTDGSGIGNYISNLAGLTQNTTYYIRAYATNANGTAYGNELSFTTTNGGGNTGAITSLNCNSATNSGTLTAGAAASGVSSSIPYTGGNGGTYSPQSVNSTGVTGLTATLTAGNFASGTGTLTYTITGTPSAAGTANFALNIGGSSCTLTRTVGAAAGAITSLNCNSATNTGTLTAGTAASGVSISIPYTGGNGGIYSAQSVNSTGGTGLTANLAAGSFANGTGTLTYLITGTPSAAGTESFALNIGGQSCTLLINIAAPIGLITSLYCGAATNSGTLIAGTAASGVSSSIPYSGGNQGAHNGQTVASTGVTGLTATLTAGFFLSGYLSYNITGTPTSSGTASFVLDIGGTNCTLTRTVSAVAGTITAMNCNNATNTGILSAGAAASGVSSSIPYSGGNGGTHNGQTVASNGVTGLTASLAAGTFSIGVGTLIYTITGTPSTSGAASFALNIGGKNCTLTRTVSAAAGSVTALNCSSATNNGTLTAGTAASGVNSVVPYTGGNGGSYNSQTVSSTGVTGLTASLTAGNFANGAGSLTYIITGTPPTSGIASFALSIGGQTCTLSLTVSAASGIISTPGAGVTFDGYTYSSIVLGNGQEWMAENLRTTLYANGDPIPNVTVNTQWQYLTTGAWAHYNNNSGYENTYGKLYNGYTVADPRNVCPVGWHVPTDFEWNTLIGYLDPNYDNFINNASQSAIAGGKMKSAGTQYWQSPNTDAFNEVGFSGLPGGARGTSSFSAITQVGYWWSNTANGTNALRIRSLIFNSGDVNRNSFTFSSAISIRCLKD
jgi:uncharacterized protein (TIGR02145 family)